MTLKRYTAFVLPLVLLATAASAQECREAGAQLTSALRELQSQRSANSEAETEYSNCVQNRGSENCKGEHSKLQSAKDDLEKALSAYKSERSSAIEGGCVQGQSGPFGKVRPLGVWPPE